MRSVLSLAVVSLLAPALAAQTPPTKTAGYAAESRPWEHQSSDLPPDPRFHFGSMKNGLRYVWVQNDNPPKQLLLRFHLDVGSMAEKSDELGLAHFMEHMAFNGSKNFKAGQLVPIFQGQGIRFGSDVNAHTWFLETVFELDLPDDEPKRLDKALSWFRDVIDGLKLEPAEIEAEKGVVDAEQTSRSGAGDELYHDVIRALLDGSRFPRRITIGEQPVRAKFDKKICTAFYDRWYRPENMTFILVGDLSGKDPKAELEKAFTDAKGRGKPVEPPDSGLKDLTLKHTLFTHPWHNLPSFDLFVGKVHAKRDEPDHNATRSAALLLALAGDMLAARMNEIVPRPYVSAAATNGESFDLARHFLFMPVVDGFSLRLATNEQSWHLALKFGEREIRRALEKGFTDEEFKAACARLEEELADKKPPPPPPTNEALLEKLLRACNERWVPMDERAAKEVLRKAAKSASKEACLAAFQKAWNDGALFICASGGLDLKDAAQEMFDDAWKEAEATRLDDRIIVLNDLSVLMPKKEKGTATSGGAGGEKSEAPAAPAAAKGDAKKFAYALADAAPDASEQKQFDDLHLTRLTFKNGVRAQLKQIEGHEGTCHFEVRVGEGMLALEPRAADVAKLATDVFLDGATNKNARDDLHAALADAHAHVDFAVGSDACVFSGGADGGATSDAARGAALRRALEVVCAYLSDAAFRAESFADFKKHLDAHLPDADRPTFVNQRRAFDELLANGDPRFLPLDRAAAQKLTLADVQGFMKSQLDGPLEVIVVGELALDQQLRHVASTFGQLVPRRAPAAIPDSRRDVAPPKTGLYEPRGAIDLDGTVTHLRIVYPCPDAIELKSERLLDLFGDIVDDRMRADIREKLGTTYSPRGDAWGDRCFRGRGFVDLEVQVDPDKLKTTREACLASMENLAKNGVKKEEFERLRAAHIGNWEALARDAGFWIHELRRASRTPAVLDDLKDLKRWYDGVTVNDVNALAKQVLTKVRASVLEITPR